MRYDEALGALKCSHQRCKVCATPASQYCSRCKLVIYCTRDCQRVDWAAGGHARECGAIVSPGRLRIPSDAMHEAMATGAPMPVDVPRGTVFVARGVHATFGSRAEYLQARARARVDGWLRTRPQSATIVSPDEVFVVPEFACAVESTIEPLDAANALFVLVENRTDPPYDGLLMYVTQRIAAGERLALGHGIVPMTMCDA